MEKELGKSFNIIENIHNNMIYSYRWTLMKSSESNSIDL